jgi:hypothetical protein
MTVGALSVDGCCCTVRCGRTLFSRLLPANGTTSLLFTFCGCPSLRVEPIGRTNARPLVFADSLWPQRVLMRKRVMCCSNRQVGCTLFCDWPARRPRRLNRLQGSIATFEDVHSCELSKCKVVGAAVPHAVDSSNGGWRANLEMDPTAARAQHIMHHSMQRPDGCIL